jgi:PAS domain S-box-containing protein
LTLGSAQYLSTDHRFELLIDSIADYAIYMLDPSGVVSNWNTGAERLKGYTADEIVGHHFSRFYTAEDRTKGLPARVLDAAAREGRYEAEGWRVRKDGSRFWASVVVDAIRNKDGVLEGFAKVTRDITERRMAQEAVRESERQFRLLVAGVTTTRSSCSTRTASSSAGMPVRSASRATSPRRSSASISRASIPSAIAPPARRLVRSTPPCSRDASRPRPGACARTEACSGRM